MVTNQQVENYAKRITQLEALIAEKDTELAQTFAQLKAGAIKPNEAAELANIAGKMIGSAKVQVEYYALRKEPPRIEWFESSNA